MRHFVCATLAVTFVTQASSGDGGCDADIVEYLKQAAQLGAETESNTRVVPEAPKTRDVSCLGEVFGRDVGIWVDFPNLADIGSEMAGRGCAAVRDAMDDILDAGSISLNAPGTGISGGTTTNGINALPASGDDRVGWLEALGKLRGGQ